MNTNITASERLKIRERRISRSRLFMTRLETPEHTEDAKEASKDLDHDEYESSNDS
jgi:hypothetical protein